MGCLFSHSAQRITYLTTLFHKWYKDICRKIVEVQVEGVPSVPPSDSVPFSPLMENPVKKDNPSPHAGNNHRNSCKGLSVLPVRICVELTLSNGLHILQNVPIFFSRKSLFRAISLCV